MAFGSGGSNRVSIAIDATNNASGVIGQVSRDLGGLQAQGSGRGGGLGGLGLGDAAALAGLAAGVGMVGAAAYDLGNNAARVEALRSSFEGLAAGVGLSSDDLLASMKTASSGAISEENLMLAANKALLLGVADTNEEFVGLLSVAKSRGQAMGLDVTQSFDNLVTGIGRGSALILDNLGFSTMQIAAAEQAYAESLGITTEEMDDNAKKAALLNVVMDEAANMGAVPGSTIDGYRRLDAEMENLKTNLGDLVQPVMGGGAGTAAAIVGSINEGLDFIQRDSLGIEQRLAEISAAMQGAQLRFEQNRVLVEAGQGSPEVMNAYIESLKELNALEREQSDLQKELAGVTRDSAGAWIPVGQQAEAAAVAQEQATQRLEAVAAAQEAATARIVAAQQQAQAAVSAVQTAAPAPVAEPDTGRGLGAIVDTYRAKGAEAGTAMVEAVAAQVDTQSATLEAAGASNAASFIAAFTASIGEKSAGIVASGTRNGALWGNAFLNSVSEGVPGALLEILADLVTPKVRAKLASDNGRTRAE